MDGSVGKNSCYKRLVRKNSLENDQLENLLSFFSVLQLLWGLNSRMWHSILKEVNILAWIISPLL